MGREAHLLEVKVDPGLCRAVGECILRAPGTFATNERGHAEFISQSREEEALVIAAARSCPNFAISVYRDGRKLA